MPKSKARKDPLFQRELLYQQRMAARWLRRDNLAAVAIALLLVILVAYTVPYSAALNRYSMYYYTIMVAEFTVWIFHALVVIRMVLISSSMITREHVGQNWDLLVLTGISARRII